MAAESEWRVLNKHRLVKSFAFRNLTFAVMVSSFTLSVHGFVFFRMFAEPFGDTVSI